MFVSYCWYNKQLLNEAYYDVKNYADRGERHPPRAEVDNSFRELQQFFTSYQRTGNFLPEGVVNHLPKKLSQIFTKKSSTKRNEGHTLLNNIGHTGIWRWLDTVFQGQYLPSLSVNYVAINKHTEKLPPVVLDKDEICHDQGCNDIRSELL